jgi:hypothetical protein
MEIGKIPCFLCGGSVEVKETVKGKPYFICDSCGLQAFIRRAKGEERLRDWMEGEGEAFKKKSGGLILEWVADLEAVKAKLKDVENKKGFFPDKDVKFIEEALKAEAEGIKLRIKEGLKMKGREG